MATTALQRLIDAVAAEKTENASVIAYIKGVPQMIRDAIAAASADGKSVEATLLDLATQLEASTTDLTAAVAANTPADPAAPAPVDPNAPVTPTT